MVGGRQGNCHPWRTCFWRTPGAGNPASDQGDSVAVDQALRGGTGRSMTKAAAEISAARTQSTAKNGTVLPLVGGFAILGVAAIGFMQWAEKEQTEKGP